VAGSRPCASVSSVRPLLLLLFCGASAVSTLLFSFCFVGCGSDAKKEATPGPIVEDDAGVDAGPSDASVFVANWNLEWFGSPEAGPTGEALQQTNVAKVMRTIDADLWAVQEISDDAALRKVGTETGHEVLIADDPNVAQGVVNYANVPQRVGILYRSARFEMRGARVVLGDHPSEFNGRCPLEVDLVTRPGGTALTVIVVHLAAGTDTIAWNKRSASAGFLKAHIDAKPPAARVMIAGDFNDGILSSSVRGRGTPFTVFVDDAANYAFASKGLESPRYARVIDHQLLTNDLATSLVPGSAQVVDGEKILSDYVSTTSDHDVTRAVYLIP